MHLSWTLLACLLFAMPAFAVEYECKVERKLDTERPYTSEQIQKGQFSVRIEESGNSARVSRCSSSASAKKVTCDRYQMDKVVFDENVKIKKYYLFRSQFDVQVFSDLFFVENNGRGGIAFGRCRVVAP
jgi:hypothetical protein